jgi:pimeloyl-ACP methyl ester carboxylesterase
MFTDRFFTAPDGPNLHYRDYTGDAARPPVLCLHGLTRNARDFESVALRLQAHGWRVIVPDVRGRGASAWADPASYALPTYLADMDALFADAGIDCAVYIGTSMGALLTMLTGAARPGRVIAAVLNDIGPVIERAGLERIASYIHQTAPMPDWHAAAARFARADGPTFPDYTAADWDTHARRRARLSEDGLVHLDYDPALAATFSPTAGNAEEMLWPLFRALAGIPLLSVRGELSDLFTADTQAAMAAQCEGMGMAVVPRAGHAPSLEEAEAEAAIDRLLDDVLTRG